ncbi:MAG: alpha-ribazole phosphatase [Candidatus Saccharimonadales bacterium]
MAVKNCKIYLIRHGESQHNRDNIISGHVDPKLTKLGRQQATATKQRLAEVRFDDVYSSDLKRAAETAAIIYGQNVPKNHQLESLRERNYGALDGQPSNKRQHIIDKHGGPVEAKFNQESWHIKHVPDMESDHEVAKRFIKAITQLARDNLGKTLLVVAHGGTIRTLLISLKHRSVETLPPGSIGNASYIELSYDGSELVVDTAQDAID